LLFVLLPNGEIEVITEFQSSSKNWAVQIWPEIEAYFAKQSDSVEQRRKQIMAKIESLEFELSQLRAQLTALDFQESQPE
jgi:DNA integrity scanning protein DisA with diadenylate cyclase activity